MDHVLLNYDLFNFVEKKILDEYLASNAHPSQIQKAKLLKRIALNYFEAISRLAKLYFEEGDYEMELYWVRIGIDKNINYCFYRMGIICMKGRENFDINTDMALYYFKLADERNIISSKFQIGMILDKQGNSEEAIKYFMEVASLINWEKKERAIAIHKIGGYYERGNGVEKDYLTALYWYRMGEVLIYPPSIFCIGRLYEHGGPGLEQNYQIAHHYYYICATTFENQYAKYEVGLLYEKGLGVPQSLKTAYLWYRSAAGNGQTNGIYQLGTLYERGVYEENFSLEKNVNEALRLYKIASDEINYYEANIRLGKIYKHGMYIEAPLNHQLSFEYFKKSENNPEAQYHIGTFYELGLLGNVNISDALMYYNLSANQNYAPAIHHLGKIYQDGLLVEKNIKLSQEYLQKAEKLGFIDNYNST